MTIWSFLIPIIFFLVITVAIALKYYYSQKTRTPTPTPAPATPVAATTPRTITWPRARPWIIGVVVLLLVLWLGAGPAYRSWKAIPPDRAELQSEYSVLATADHWPEPIPVKPGKIRFLTIPDTSLRIQIPAGAGEPGQDYIFPKGHYVKVPHNQAQKAWRFRAIEESAPVQVEVWWEK